MPVTRSQAEGSRPSASETTGTDSTTATDSTATTTTATTTTATTSDESQETGTTSQESATARSSGKKNLKSKTTEEEVPATQGCPAPSVKTVRPRALSCRSVASRKRLLAELEAKERLAELKMKQIQAAVELEETKLQRMRAESTSDLDDDEVEEEDQEMVTQKVDMWFERHRKDADQTEPHATAGRGQEAEKSQPARQPVPKKKEDISPSTSIEISALASALSEVARVNRVSTRVMQELPQFSGQGGEWLSFRAAYHETKDTYTVSENVARLRRSLKGSALEAVHALLLTQNSPDVILQTLERRFGRPDALVLAELEKIKTLARVTDNPRDLCVFANKIANVVAIIEVIKKPQYLHSPEVMRATVDKLTPILKNKWYDYANIKDEELPELKKLSLFLNDEADKCAPYASLIDEETKTRRRPEKTYATQQSSNKSERDARCPACKQDHKLTTCAKFIDADISTRWDIARGSKLCFQCLSERHRRFKCQAKLCGVDGCKSRHHKLLHYERREEQPKAQPVEEKEVVASVRDNTTQPRRAFLKVAQITLQGPKKSVETFALLDEGSTVTMIDENLAKEVGIRGPLEPLIVQGVSGKEVTHHRSERITARVRGKFDSEDRVIQNARTVDELKLFTQSVRRSDVEDCPHLDTIREELLHPNVSPRILIGQDNWELIVSRKIRQGARHQPVASLTQLGWVLHGCKTSQANPVAYCSHLTASATTRDPLEDMMKKYFDIESLGVEAKRPASDPEQVALRMLEEKSRRLQSGRFETGLLWKNEKEEIPNNYDDTMKRLRSLEKKLDRNTDLRGQYEERIANLINKGYAEKSTAPPTGGRVWYLPHFAVVNPDKEKIRLVHDAAAKSHGRSLNDMLLPGPDLLQSLPAVLMKFRQHPIAVSSDIKEMFMQVKIREEDRDALRFLWRDRRREGPPDEYRMTSLIFGATSSPCSALYIKNRNAEDYKEKHPEAARAIIDNHYMDDYLHSFSSIEEAARTIKDVDNIHKRAGFELRGWTSNNENVLNEVPEESRTAKLSPTIELGGELATEKTLGLLWHVDEDKVGFRLNKKHAIQVQDKERPPTKREALSLIMSIFDPLGLISPVTTPAKRIMQDTWRYKTGWDEEIPEALLTRWTSWLATLQTLNTLRVPRCYDYEPAMYHELHTFVDASEEAYVAAVYIRSVRADGSVNIALAQAKSRVTPTKPVSIPRLELQAALLGSRLARSVEDGHDWQFSQRTFWSDSRTALAWIRGEPRTYKTFVAHRLAEIGDLTKQEEWRWVPTASNPADDATRQTPSDFHEQHRWFRGPSFLYQTEESWPTEVKEKRENTGEERDKSTCYLSVVKTQLIDINRFSTWEKLVRTTARVLQFVDLCRRRNFTAAVRRKRTKKNSENDRDWSKTSTSKKETKNKTRAVPLARRMKTLEADYLLRAECLLIKQSQSDTSTEEWLEKLSTYRRFEDGILRLRGRVNEAADVSYDAANPIILDGRHRYTKLYIQHVHEKLHHGGIEIVVNELRQRLWIVRIRPTVKEVLKSCLRCRLMRAKPAQPSTGNLPAARLAHHARPFTFTGLDYFGPQEVTVARHREKRYIALFTCMTSRAVHLEVVTSLSTDSAINALRRFIARRGCPAELWSDNATCFRSADRELTASFEAMKEEAEKKRIRWRFLPPSAPFMAGAWERLVGVVKTALRATLTDQRPSDETLATLLAEAEATVNSRPLTHVGVTEDDAVAITPNLILLGPDCHNPPPWHLRGERCHIEDTLEARAAPGGHLLATVGAGVLTPTATPAGAPRERSWPQDRRHGGHL